MSNENGSIRAAESDDSSFYKQIPQACYFYTRTIDVGGWISADIYRKCTHIIFYHDNFHVVENYRQEKEFVMYLHALAIIYFISDRNSLRD